MKFTRRQFLTSSALGGLAFFSPVPAWSAASRTISTSRYLSFYNVHTGEYLNACYRKNRRYCHATLEDINYIMRDHRTGEIKSIDSGLLDLLYDLSRHLQTLKPFHIISGYRSQATNDMLRSRNQNVAKRSLHLQGKAIDIRLPGCSISSLRRVAASLKGGGVGYYPRSQFVHLDTGKVRYW